MGRDFTRASSSWPVKVFCILGVFIVCLCCTYIQLFIVVSSDHDRDAFRWALDRALLIQLLMPNPARLLISGTFLMIYCCDTRRAVMEMSYINKMYGMFTSSSRVVNMAQAASKGNGLARFNCL